MAVPTPESDSAAPSPILIADDNRVNQNLAVAMLERLGYRAEVVGDGAQAVEAVAATRYGAVLMDCEMPRMDGYQAASEIRKREGGIHRVPIIAMTAAALESDRDKCLAAGMDDYISKPVDMKELEDKLRRWVGGEESASRTASPDLANRGTSLDSKRVAELRALKKDQQPSALSVVARIFLRDTPIRMKSLSEEVSHRASTRAEEIREHAHYLRGAAANLGAVRMAALSEELETLGRSGDLRGAPDLFSRLEAEFDRVRSALSDALRDDRGADGPGG